MIPVVSSVRPTRITALSEVIRKSKTLPWFAAIFFELQLESDPYDPHAAHHFSAHVPHGAKDVLDPGAVWRCAGYAAFSFLKSAH